MISIAKHSLRIAGIVLLTLSLALPLSAQEHQSIARSLFHLENELINEPARLTRYVTQEPRIQTAEEVARLAKQFGLEAKVVERENKFLVKQDLRVLELFREKGTGYIRYSDNAELAAEKEVTGLQPDTLVAKARDLLKANNLLPESAVVLGTRYSEFEQTGNKGEVIASGKSSLAVMFGFELDGMRVLGPGAKARVVFGDNDKVIGTSLIWREIEPEGEMQLIGQAEAFERFKQLWPPEKVDNASIQTDIFIEKIENALYAEPGMYPQAVLEPVYLFKGYFEIKGMAKQGEIREKEHFRILIAASEDADKSPVITTGPVRQFE